MIRILLSALLLMTIVSCENQQPLGIRDKEEEDPRAWVKVIFDWTECPEADPEDMELYFFPADGSHYFRYSFPAKEAVRVYIPKGRYSLVALNTDCDNVEIINPGRYDNFTVALKGSYDYSPETSPVRDTDDPASAGVFLPPGYLWTSWIDDIEVTDDDIVVPMAEAFCRYSVEIRNFQDMNRVSSIQGVLYGCHEALGFKGASDGYAHSSGMFFSMGNDASCYPGPSTKNLRTKDTPAKTVASGQEDDKSRFYGEFLTLGHCGRSRISEEGTLGDKPHSMHLRYRLTDGRTAVMNVDVSDQVHSQPTERCHIVLDALKLPTPDYSNGNVSLEDWNVIDFSVAT